MAGAAPRKSRADQLVDGAFAFCFGRPGPDKLFCEPGCQLGRLPALKVALVDLRSGNLQPF